MCIALIPETGSVVFASLPLLYSRFFCVIYVVQQRQMNKNGTTCSKCPFGMVTPKLSTDEEDYRLSVGIYFPLYLTQFMLEKKIDSIADFEKKRVHFLCVTCLAWLMISSSLF